MISNSSEEVAIQDLIFDMCPENIESWKLQKKPLSLVNWNGHQLHVVLALTTGPDPNIHDIYHLTVLPLDCNIEYRKDIIPFSIDIRPRYPDIQEQGYVTKSRFQKVLTQGQSQYKANDLFEFWYNKLDLSHNKYGTRRKIIPLAYNFASFNGHLINLFGITNYRAYFHPQYRDILTSAAFVDDVAGSHVRQVPYAKFDLPWICNKINVDNTHLKHDLIKANAIAQVYKKQLIRSLI